MDQLSSSQYRIPGSLWILHTLKLKLEESCSICQTEIYKREKRSCYRTFLRVNAIELSLELFLVLMWCLWINTENCEAWQHFLNCVVEIHSIYVYISNSLYDLCMDTLSNSPIRSWFEKSLEIWPNANAGRVSSDFSVSLTVIPSGLSFEEEEVTEEVIHD